PLTQYTVRACSGDNKGNEITVTTQASQDLPDGDFEQWWLNGKIWCPWSEGGTQFWDTGNTGAATLGESNVQPSDYVPAGLSGQSAQLKTEFKGVFGIGKLAAGSIYTGTFKKVDGTNGILDFGRPWSLRPTKLRGYYQYTTGDIDYSSKEMEYLKGRPDTCSIYIAMTDWTAPYEIRTNPNNRQLFDKNASYVIGYGQLERGSSMDAYEEFEIKLDYRSTSLTPTYIMITCASSKYGDYFTGSTSSVLYVDQLSLDYDY
ncbi:MAG: PCMD domain-containing protein, partial [Muribaculaceae bacterium]|nr:PCMD domain-containing protein [Muribaculaceae bacterium]